MDDLTYGLKTLCRRNRDGSYATQGDRLRSLTLIARELREEGFRNMQLTSLKRKHVDALVRRWQAKGLSAGTQKNRLAHLRWWAEKTGKSSAIPASSAELGIPERRFVTNESKARELSAGSLEKVRDPHVLMSLVLQQMFGLRREEAIKFQPRYADRGDHIVLKHSWTKGGRERAVPILTAEQRAALDQAHKLAGAGSLIPPHRSYKEQRDLYDGECKAARLSSMHGLRHRYAQMRFEALTGFKCPAAGGPLSRLLSPAQCTLDELARQIISNELGHERIEITAVYLGR
jgi:hypothetical protein